MSAATDIWCNWCGTRLPSHHANCLPDLRQQLADAQAEADRLREKLAAATDCAIETGDGCGDCRACLRREALDEADRADAFRDRGYALAAELRAERKRTWEAWVECARLADSVRNLTEGCRTMARGTYEATGERDAARAAQTEARDLAHQRDCDLGEVREDLDQARADLERLAGAVEDVVAETEHMAPVLGWNGKVERLCVLPVTIRDLRAALPASPPRVTPSDLAAAQAIRDEADATAERLAAVQARHGLTPAEPAAVEPATMVIDVGQTGHAPRSPHAGAYAPADEPAAVEPAGPCPECGGAGTASRDGRPCPRCDGSGKRGGS